MTARGVEAINAFGCHAHAAQLVCPLVDFNLRGSQLEQIRATKFIEPFLFIANLLCEALAIVTVANHMVAFLG